PSNSHFVLRSEIFRSLHDRVTVRIPRLGAEVGVHRPAPQNALALHSDFFHHPRRSEIVHIADRPDAVNFLLLERPSDQTPKSFSHVTASPKGTREHVTKLPFLSPDACDDHTDHLFVLAALDRPMKCLADVPRKLAHAHVLTGLFEILVGAPTHVSGDFG